MATTNDTTDRHARANGKRVLVSFASAEASACCGAPIRTFAQSGTDRCEACGQPCDVEA